jgi:hypothetical protein
MRKGKGNESCVAQEVVIKNKKIKEEKDKMEKGSSTLHKIKKWKQKFELMLF